MNNDELRDWLIVNQMIMIAESTLTLNDNQRMVGMLLTYIGGALERNRLESLMRHVEQWIVEDNAG